MSFHENTVDALQGCADLSNRKDTHVLEKYISSQSNDRLKKIIDSAWRFYCGIKFIKWTNCCNTWFGLGVKDKKNVTLYQTTKDLVVNLLC